MRPDPPRFPVIRRPPTRLVVAAVLALLAATTVYRSTAAATARAAALGETTVVAVATTPLDPGDEIGRGDITMTERPVAHVPERASGSDPTGLTVRSPVGRGEIITADRVAGEDRSGAAALVPEGWRAIPVPILDAALPAAPGDLVDVIASFDPAVTARDPSLVVAADAVVVDISDDAVTVAVTRERVTEVAFALANGIVTLALVG